MSEDPQHDSTKDAETVRIVPRASLSTAVDLLLEVYSEEPSFRELYRFGSAEEAQCTRPIFEGICDPISSPDCVLGYFDGDDLVGVLAFVPSFKFRLSSLLRHPGVLANLAYAHLKRPYFALRARSRFGTRKLPPVSRILWRNYIRLANAQRATNPKFHVLAFAVRQRSQRRGVARALLAALEDLEPWSTYCHYIEVNTWTHELAQIYEKLGFTAFRQASRGGVSCWTLLRPIARHFDSEETSQPPHADA